jgi:uncharacterized protein
MHAIAARRFQVINLRTNAIVGCVDLADSGPARRRGLLGRKGLDEGEGLWIKPCEAVHTFGMKFDIDLIFLNRRRIVTKVRANLRPWRVSGSIRAGSVLEMSTGTIARSSTVPGDELSLQPLEAPA